jgi:hypothetical protein
MAVLAYELSNKLTFKSVGRNRMSNNYFNQTMASYKLKCLSLIDMSGKSATEIVKEAEILYDFVVKGSDKVISPTPHLAQSGSPE